MEMSEAEVVSEGQYVEITIWDRLLLGILMMSIRSP